MEIQFRSLEFVPFSYFLYTCLSAKQIREELETTSEGEGIENQVQGEENRVRDLSTVSSAEELDAESSKDNSVITEMSAQEVNQTMKQLSIMS